MRHLYLHIIAIDLRVGPYIEWVDPEPAFHFLRAQVESYTVKFSGNYPFNVGSSSCNVWWCAVQGALWSSNSRGNGPLSLAEFGENMVRSFRYVPCWKVQPGHLSLPNIHDTATFHILEILREDGDHSNCMSGTRSSPEVEKNGILDARSLVNRMRIAETGATIIQIQVASMHLCVNLTG